MTITPKDPSLLERLRQARAQRDRGEEAFAEAVRAAMADREGATVQEIAEAAGISRERAYQIKAGRR